MVEFGAQITNNLLLTVDARNFIAFLEIWICVSLYTEFLKIAILRSVHSPQQHQQKDEQQQIHLLNCSKLSVGVEPKRRAPPVRQRHVSMPKGEEDSQRHGDTLAGSI
ncbi:hypothetical protein niasHS_004185 [Heterodera schachtii]|uniref:Uncharacterized protein n=1 Tax=Heterodera schachtii TaxID=97005 RepID=A0ABD2K0V3_HETSC